MRPLDHGPLHHLEAAVRGHAEIVAAIADHVARQFARHPSVASSDVGTNTPGPA